MRRGLLAAAAVAAAACAMTAGCGQQQAGSPAAGQSTGSRAASSPAATPTGSATRCVAPRLRGPNRTFTVTNADNGKTFCVRRGTRIYVFLHGTRARPWSPIRPQSAILARVPSGVLTLMIGETGGFFEGRHTGSAALTSERAPCLAKHALCNRQSSFRVTVVVTR